MVNVAGSSVSNYQPIPAPPSAGSPEDVSKKVANSTQTPPMPGTNPLPLRQLGGKAVMTPREEVFASAGGKDGKKNVTVASATKKVSSFGGAKQTRRKGSKASLVDGQVDDETFKLHPMESVVALLAKDPDDDAQHQLEKRLTAALGALDAYGVLLRASGELETTDIDGRKLDPAAKSRLRTALKGMLQKVSRKHRDEIRAALTGQEEYFTALQAPRTAEQMKALRYMVSGTSAKADTPLRGRKTLERVIDLVGEQNVEQVLSHMRNYFANELAVRARANRDGVYMVAMGDSVYFSQLTAAIGTAQQLRVGLADKDIGAILSDPKHVGKELKGVAAEALDLRLTLFLMTIAETGYGPSKTQAVIEGIFNPDNFEAFNRARAYGEILRAVEGISEYMWPADKIGARADLINGIRTKALEADAEMPRQPSQAEQHEEKMLAILNTQLDDFKHSPGNRARDWGANNSQTSRAPRHGE